MLAANTGDVTALEIILAHPDVKLEAVNENTGETALFYASIWGSGEAAAVLIDNGANRKHLNAKGRTATDEARQHNRHSLAKAIEAYVPNPALSVKVSSAHTSLWQTRSTTSHANNERVSLKVC